MIDSFTYLNNTYRFEVKFSPEDNEYYGTCFEYPSLSHFDKTEELAMTGIKGLVKAVLFDILNQVV
jgi:hypothetical protein